jgi:hypothetical protein
LAGVSAGGAGIEHDDVAQAGRKIRTAETYH